MVGVAVPFLIALCFWSVVRQDWQFWLACYVVGFPAGVFAIWIRQIGREYWVRLESSTRMMLRTVAMVILWFLLALQNHDRSDRFFIATFITVAVALFWGGYALFSRVMDAFVARIRGR